MLLGSTECRGKYEHERVGCAEAMSREFFMKLVFLLFAQKSAEERRGYEWKRTDLCRARWKDGRRTSPVYIYRTPVFTVD